MAAVERRVEARQPLGHHGHDRRGRSSPNSTAAARPASVLPTTRGRWKAGWCKQQLLDLALDDRRLFLDDQQVGQALGEGQDARGSSG
jgi:hypothetical protein